MGRLRPQGGGMRIVAVLVAVLAVPAIAAAAIHKSGSRPIEPATLDDATTGCGNHQVVSGGGFAAGSGYEGLVPVSAPAGKDAWKSQLSANDFAESSTWRNYAVCSGGSVRIVTKTDPVQNFGVFIKVRCPKGKNAIGGGWAVDPPYDAGADSGTPIDIVGSSRFSKRGWLINGVSDENVGVVTAYAVCSKRKVTEVVKRRNLDDPGPLSATAKCGRGERVASGGFDFYGAPISLSASRPATTRSWQAKIIAFFPPDDDAYLKAFAYCVG